MSYQPGTLIDNSGNSLAAFAPEALRPTPVDATDCMRTDAADIITTVCRNLGVFTAEAAEQAPKFLRDEIAALRKAHPSLALEPFMAINLTERFGLDALTANFNRTYRAEFPPTKPWDRLWPHYNLANINRRTVDDRHEPASYSLRGHVLTTGQNEYGELGLVGTTKGIEAQRKLARGRALLNVTDWLFIESGRRELGKPSLDRKTITRFPQMEQIPVDGVSFVGCADSVGRRAVLRGSDGWAYPGVGVRFSVGPKA